MFKAISSFFAVIVSLCTAAETASNSINILAKVGEDMANDLRDNAAHERELKRMEHRAKVAERAKQLGYVMPKVEEVKA